MAGKTTIVLLGLILVLSLTGCGNQSANTTVPSRDSVPPAEEVLTPSGVVEHFFTACKEGRLEEAKSYLTADEWGEWMECGGYEELRELGTNLLSFHIEREEIIGSQAMVIVRVKEQDGDELIEPIFLQREGNKWKINGAGDDCPNPNPFEGLYETQQSNQTSEIKSDEELVSDFARELVVKVINQWVVKDEKGEVLPLSFNKEFVKPYLANFADYVASDYEYPGLLGMFPGNNNLLPLIPPVELEKLHGIRINDIRQYSSNKYIVFVLVLFNAKDSRGEVMTYKGDLRFYVTKVDGEMKLSEPIMCTYDLTEYRP